jgi:hypothetical protein
MTDRSDEKARAILEAVASVLLGVVSGLSVGAIVAFIFVHGRLAHGGGEILNWVFGWG